MATQLTLNLSAPPPRPSPSLAARWRAEDNDEARHEDRAARFDRLDAQTGSHLGDLNGGKHLL